MKIFGLSLIAAGVFVVAAGLPMWGVLVIGMGFQCILFEGMFS